MKTADKNNCDGLGNQDHNRPAVLDFSAAVLGWGEEEIPPAEPRQRNACMNLLCPTVWWWMRAFLGSACLETSAMEQRVLSQEAVMLGLPQGDGRGGISSHEQTGIAEESSVPDYLIHSQHREVSPEMAEHLQASETE